MTVKIYGIPNCDTMKKAFDFLKANGVAYDFHDYKTQGIGEAQLKSWAKTIGWEKLLNKGSTTFKDLPDASKADLDETKAIKLMLAQPSMIKRPIWEVGGGLYAGFKPNSPERKALEAAITEL
ncbi:MULTISPECIES: arsenate reductase [Asticcacaulis]|uniref:arsenate reductase n=1 Tax=Asticcacaulis TaxID=76890 RepID=UPI001AEB5432|nr:MULTISPECIES: arsenate reductase [Asticcacaulis]MBP2158872.1 Spx/MgsR family transcriptional regulator [Asticcacaulis solisilvae]MDR6799917.1 Spx/MgsR family transcriptional regulator [Asticcacaulis sp. BE141]